MHRFCSRVRVLSAFLAAAALLLAAPAEANIVAQRYFLPGSYIRLAGADRYETTIKVSEYNFGGPGTATNIVLVSGEDFPDALAAAPLASWIDAPIFMTPHNMLRDDVASAIRWVFDGQDDPFVDAYIVGGTDAVSTTVEQQLQQQHPNLDIKRVAGRTRGETAAAVARELDGVRGSPPDTVFVAAGSTFADALAASGAASDRSVDSKLMPILLNQHAGELDSTVSSLLASYSNLKAIYVVGGTTVLDDSFFAELNAAAQQLPGAPTVVRYAGANRYGTSAAVAERFYGTASPASVGIASGESFADSIVGGADSGKAWHSQANYAPQAFLLVQPEVLPQEARDFLSAHKATLSSTIVYGGTAAVRDAVAQQVVAAI